MEPLSAAASLLAFIHAAHIGIKGIQKFNACRKAPKELDRFWTELESLEALLESVRTFIDRNSSMTYCDILSTPVWRPRGFIALIRYFIRLFSIFLVSVRRTKRDSYGFATSIGLRC